jgi:hypothetical protein
MAVSGLSQNTNFLETSVCLARLAGKKSTEEPHKVGVAVLPLYETRQKRHRIGA